MKRFPLCLPVVLLLPAAGLLLAQNFAPPPAQTPTEAQLKQIAERSDKLGHRLLALRRQDVRDPQLAEVEIFHKAAEWIMRHNEFYTKEAADWTIEALEHGLVRATQ